MVGDTRGLPSVYAVRLLATAASLAFLLLLVRGRMIQYGEGGWESLGAEQSLPTIAAWALLGVYQDVLYVAGITLVFGALLWLAPKQQKLVYRVFVGLALFSLAVAFANRLIVESLGRPLTYQWLYYSDFLRSQEAKNAVLAGLSGRQILITVIGLAVMLALAPALKRCLDFLLRRFGWRRVGAAGLLLVLLYLSVGAVLLSQTSADPRKLANPVVFFARSVATARGSGPLLTRRTSMGPDDFEPRPPEPGGSAIAARAKGRVRNVVLFVLESAAAQYTGAYGAPYGATPKLDGALGRALLFTNFYTHLPTTPSSLVSLLLSIYPLLSYKSLTQEHPTVPFPSLSSELARRGYRTAFFSSADSRFQRGDVFLAHRNFDRIEDYRSLPCPGPPLRARGATWKFMDGMDDVCIADAFRDWIPETPKRPFFAVLWTMMTHYPYFAAGKERDFGIADRKFNRYLNGLHRGDEALGRLLRTLEERHLTESTLVAVLGDHGETFGQHHHRGHAGKLYEEDLHIPLVLICPGLFQGERIPTVGGLIDLAPTVLDLLGFGPPREWQGRSLFRSDRTGRVYFHAPFSEDLYGFREGDRKFIYSASFDQTELYDLAADPQENVNRADAAPEAVRLGKERLVAWAQYQDRFLRRVIAGGGPDRRVEGAESRRGTIRP